MRTCRYTGLECDQPHLACWACDTYQLAKRGLADALQPPTGFLTEPDIHPYVKFVTPTKHIGIEIGVKGTF